MRWTVPLVTCFIFVQPALASLKKCVDDQGMFHYYGRVMPPECRDKTTVEMNTRGVVIGTHVVEAGTAAAEDSAQEEVDAQQLASAKRYDSVLLNTYTSEKEIDWAMERNIHPVELAIAGVEKRLEIAENQLQALQQQADKAEKSGSAMLASIQQEMIPVTRNVAQLQNELKKNHKRIKRLKEKFSADKKRFQALKAQNF